LAIRAATKKVGAALIIDGTQSVGALPFDIQTIQPDAVVCAGYKWLMGPYGIGMAYFGEMFDHGSPIEENWINRKNSDDFANLVNYESEYREGAARYGAGEQSSFILLPMLKEAIKQLNKWKPENIQTYCETLVKEPLEQIKDLGLFVEEPEFRSAHLFGIQCPIDKLESIQRAFKKHKVSVSFRGDFVRVSPHVYNDERDINRLVRAFQEVFK
jgi:selenocysteine lyase/cysteine desulfurase